jgi:uncharacterized protein YydD (DUF2326 family)
MVSWRFIRSVRKCIDLTEDDNIELINDLFNDEWGGDSKPLTAVSLKQADAQGGKAKAMLNKFANAKEDYNLTKDEIDLIGNNI